MLFRTFLLLFFVHFFYQAELFKIPLYRHKTAREIFWNFPYSHQKSNEIGPKPTPIPITNESVPLFRYLDSEYYGIVGIGKPVRYFKMIFDTAWGNSWVMSSNCDYTQIGCMFHTKYNSEKSFTYKPVGTPFVVNEGTYNISGYMSKDDFYIAHLKLKNYTFAEIDKLSWRYIYSKADGVLGMGLPNLSIGNGLPFVYDMIKKGIIKKPMFTVNLNRDKQSNRGGHIFLGMRDPKFKGTYTYLPVIGKTYWQIKMDRVIVDNGNKSFGFCEKSCNTILDTSTNEITGPSSEIAKINKLLNALPIPKIGKYQVSCSKINKLPHISFYFNGNNFTLKGEQYIQEVGVEGVQLCISSFTPKNDTNWALGGCFLSAFSTLFDLGKNVVGIGST